MVRTPGGDKSVVTKRKWTPEEDRKLIAYVTRYGCWNWRQLPRFAGLSRCGKSCRLRWLNYLRPDIKRGNYTEEEEETIIKLHEKLGNRWSAIAAHLPGRTDNEIKNHWHTNLKKRVQQNHVHSEKATPVESKDESAPEFVYLFQSTTPAIPSSTNSSAASYDHFQEDGFDMNDLDKLFLDPLMNDNMWTESLMEESWYTPSEIYADTAFCFPTCDGEILRQNIMYEEYQGLFG